MTRCWASTCRKASRTFDRSDRDARAVLASSHIVKIRPGFRILFGSSARLSVRIVSISSRVLLIFRYGRSPGKNPTALGLWCFPVAIDVPLNLMRLRWQKKLRVPPNAAALDALYLHRPE